MHVYEIKLANEAATVALGSQIAEIVKTSIYNPLIVFLNGDLGAGKTTLTRGFVRGFGFVGNVKSPTYTIVEPYESTDYSIYHFDLYRLADPEELEFLGIRDYFSKLSYSFIEWPERAKGFLPPEDLVINIAYDGEQRIATIESYTEQGKLIVQQLIECSM